MALSPFPQNSLSLNSTLSTSPSLSSIIFHPQTHSSNSFTSLKFRVSCSQHTIQINTQQHSSIKKKRKPKPSFFDQIRDKWSAKTPLLSEKFPWEEREKQQSEPIEDEEEDQSNSQSFGAAVTESEIDKDQSVSDPVSFAPKNSVVLAPWVHGNKPKKTQFDFVNSSENDKTIDGFHRHFGENVHESKNLESEANFDGKYKSVVEIDETPIEFSRKKAIIPCGNKKIDGFHGHYEENVSSNVQESKNLESEVNFDGKYKGVVETDEPPTALSEKTAKLPGEDIKRPYFKGSSDKIDSMSLPWVRKSDLGSVGGDRLRNGNAMSAEKLIPETELRRLRNVALRMVERIKVRADGVTQALVDSIHEKWKEDEVVKLKFEGPPSINMKRTHEILETRTGGLVIWRSGSSVVLYRGMAYKLPCVQSYIQQNQDNLKNPQSSKDIVGDLPNVVGLKDSVRNAKELNTTSTRYLRNLSQEEIMDFSELDHLLDNLGPRFKDWSGREPLPVDADLLPPVVPGYKLPFRVLPYGIRHGLRDKEMTFYRRAVRTMPPHFALGRNRQLQGLAMAMVKLWERSAIAKIAIKRGVQNTCNERMAQELKILTGGTLLSRNKDYIVFYRGNDFLPPVVRETMVEAQEETALQQDEEDQARWKASTLIHSNTEEPSEVRLVAGTLAETMAATSRWGKQPNSQDIEKMMRDSALERHAALVRYLEKKLTLAKGKIKKAEKALEKVQESLEPAELPTDLETISDEERFLFRKIGLSMKPYLLLGRRGVFDGTVENIHLHWKYRELVKIMVERKSFSQVKHFAISLEAESGGVLISLDKTTKGYVIILYRGKNYQRPDKMRPRNLLTRRQALARSIELQRREALKHHILDLTERIEKLKSELEEMKIVNEIDEETFYSRVDDASSSDDEMEVDDDEEDDEEAYLEIYDTGNDDSNI
ncbi:CRM-domain containing factor CFM3, chloroplastic/mitochondrial-like [Actinidia eriantha]|uniref:CRM-domain containing factor CFM3, chloroplastic/mitochondrial-like n=1 Tax=Actinidia eriantha TaxID=165200 RepID=UPI002584BDFF|nr:CRM-domain containing factor CFM3, chloroplastic/mitochondrial-like [Actinidia eriantha]